MRLTRKPNKYSPKEDAMEETSDNRLLHSILIIDTTNLKKLHIAKGLYAPYYSPTSNAPDEPNNLFVYQIKEAIFHNICKGSFHILQTKESH